ncbi:MAG: hypothetical protein EAY75_04480 [Bacteroidetes bacterium]|nr:MAG: hypothetical protein EAY75_04480 [Bacteroidota bacterium]
MFDMFGKTSPERHLLLINTAAMAQPEDLQAELEGLHLLLNSVDDIYHCALACEIADLNRYKKITSRAQVAAYLQPEASKPFVFVMNLN